MNPSGYHTEDKDRKNHTFDRLKKWFTHAGVDYFSFVNCSHKLGEVKFCDVDYDTLSKCIDGNQKIVALGNFSSTVLSRLNITHLKLPHPSPRNRIFNDKSYEPEMLKELKRYVRSR
jgi:hypothetical protein